MSHNVLLLLRTEAEASFYRKLRGENSCTAASDWLRENKVVMINQPAVTWLVYHLHTANTHHQQGTQRRLQGNVFLSGRTEVNVLMLNAT